MTTEDLKAEGYVPVAVMIHTAIGINTKKAL